MSELSKVFNVTVKGNADDLIDRLSQAIELNDELQKKSEHEISIKFNPNEPKSVINEFKKLIEDPSVLKIDTKEAENKLKALKEQYEGLDSKTHFSSNGIMAISGKGSVAAQTKAFKDLTSEIKLTEKEMQKVDSLAGKSGKSNAKEELELEQKLFKLYGQSAKEVKEITSAKDWQEDAGNIERLTQLLQNMYDIQDRFKTNASKNLLGLDADKSFKDFETLRGKLDSVLTTIKDKRQKIQQELDRAIRSNSDVDLLVNNIDEAIKHHQMTSTGGSGTGTGIGGAGGAGTNANLEQTDEELKEIKQHSEEAATNIAKLNSAINSGGDISDAYGLEEFNEALNAFESKAALLKNKVDIISDDDIQDVREYEETLKQLEALQTDMQSYQSNAMTEAMLGGIDKADSAAISEGIRTIDESIDALTTHINALKAAAEKAKQPVKEVTSSLGTNPYAKGATKVQGYSGKITAGGFGSGNGSGSGTGSGSGLGTGTGTGSVPPEIHQKLILDTSEAESKLTAFREKAEKPVETSVNMTGTITTDLSIVKEEIKEIEGNHLVRVEMAAQNEELLDTIAEKIKALKSSSNIEVKVATEELGKAKATVGVKLPSQKEVLAQVNSTLLAIEPRLHKLQLKFKDPVKKELLTPVNNIIKEVQEKTNKIPVTLSFTNQNTSKVDSLTNKLLDVAEAADLIQSQSRNAAKAINESISSTLPTLNEAKAVVNEIAAQLKAIKGLNLNIKNVTYKQGEKTVKTDNKQMEKARKEAEKTTAALHSAVKAKEKFLGESKDKNAANNGIDAYKSVLENQRLLQVEIEKAKKALTDKAPIATQEKLAESIEKQSNALKTAEKDYKAQKELLATIEAYKANDKFTQTANIVNNPKSADLVKSAIQEQVAELDNLEKELKEAALSWEDLTEKEEKFKAIQDKLRANARLDKKTVTYSGTLDEVKGKIEDKYGRMQSWSGIKVDATTNKNEKRLTYSYIDQNGALKTLSATYREATQAAYEYTKSEKEQLTWTGRLTNSIKNKSREFLAYMGTFASFYAIMNTVRQGLSIMKQMDDAMTELKKVSDDSASSVEAFRQKSFELGNEVGATGNTITQAAAEWARLGYSIREVQDLSKASSVYVNVGDGIDAVTATQDLVSTMKAFHIEAEDIIGIVDRLNEVSNSYAVSSEGLGAALKRSSSALQKANNDLDQSIAMITATNEILQDPEQVGNVLKILSLRIRGASADLKKMGEDEEGLITSTASLQALIQKLTQTKDHTGVNILEPDNKTFRSTYEIMKDISKVWDQMNDTSQSALLQAIAGKSRANGVAALLSNFEQAENALKTSQEAAGSALAENEKYLNSVSGRLSLLSNQWQKMWVNAVDSNAAKFFIDLGTNILKLINNFGALGTATAAVLGTLTAMDKLNLSNIINFFKNLNLSNIRYNIGTFFDDRSVSQINSSVIDKLQAGFAGKNLKDIKDYVLQQGYLTQAFKDQFIACGTANEVESLLIATRTSEVGITTGLIAKEIALKALRAAAVAGVVLLISAAVKHHQEYKRALDETRQATMDAGKAETEHYKALQEAYEAYNNLEKTNGKVVSSEEKLGEVTAKVNDALENKAEKLSGVIEGSKEYSEKLDEIFEKEQRNAAMKAEEAYVAVKDDFKDNFKGKRYGIADPVLNNDVLDDTTKQAYINRLSGLKSVSNYQNGGVPIITTKDIKTVEDLCQKYEDLTADEIKLTEEINNLQEAYNNLYNANSFEGEQLNLQIQGLTALRSEIISTKNSLNDMADAAKTALQNRFTTTYRPKNASEFKRSVDEFVSKDEFKGNEDAVRSAIYDSGDAKIQRYVAELDTVAKAYDILKDKTSDYSITQEKLQEAVDSGIISLSELNTLMSDGFESKGIDVAADSFEGLIQNIKASVSAYNEAQVTEMSLSDQLNASGEAIDDIQKKIATIAELIPKAMNPEGLNASETIDLLQDMNKAFSEMGQDFDLKDVSDLDQLDDLLKKLIADGEWLDKTLDNLAISDSLKNSIKQAAQEEIAYKSAVQGTVSSMNSLSSAYSSIRGVIDEYNKAGQFSYSTIANLLSIEPQYLAMLEMKKGKLSINIEMLQLLIDKQKATAIESLQAAKCAALEAAAQVKAAEGANISNDAHANVQSTLYDTANAYNTLANAALNAAIAESAANKSRYMEMGLTSSEIAKISAPFDQAMKNVAAFEVKSMKSADKVMGYVTKGAQKAADSVKKTAKDALDKIVSELKNAYDDGALSMKEYLSQMKTLADQYYAEGKITQLEYMEYERQYYRGVVDMYKEAAAAIQRYFDKKKEPLNDRKELIQDEINELREQEDAYERAYDKRVKVLEKEKKVLEEEKQTFEDSYEAQIKKIEKKQKKLEKQIKTYEKERQAIEDSQKAIARRIDTLTDEQALYQQMQKDIERQKRPFETQKQELQDQVNLLEKQQKEIEKQKAVYEERIKIIEREKSYIEKQTKELEKQKEPLERQKKFSEEQVKLLEKQEKIYNKQVKALQRQQKEITKKINLLEESKKPYQDQLDILNEQREALEKQNQAREDAINLQKAQYALEQAHQQRTNLILKNGQYVYEADPSAVRDAEEGLQNAKYQHEVQQIEIEIDFNNEKIKEIEDKIKPLTEKNEGLQKSIDGVQESIEILRDAMDAWNEKSESVQSSIDKITDKINEVKSATEGLDDQIEAIKTTSIEPLDRQNQALADHISQLNDRIEEVDNSLEGYERRIKSVDINIDNLEKQIEKLNRENEKYNELLEPIDDKLEQLKRKNDKYSESIDELREKLDKITAKYDKQIKKIDKKIEKLDEERKAFKEGIDDQIYKLEQEEKTIDKQITAWDRYARQFQRVIDEWQLAKDEKLLEGIFGGNWKERLDALDPTLVEDFAKGFRQACEDMRASALRNLPEAIKLIEEAAKAENKAGGGEGSGGGAGGGAGGSGSPTTPKKSEYNWEAYFRTQQQENMMASQSASNLTARDIIGTAQSRIRASGLWKTTTPQDPTQLAQAMDAMDAYMEKAEKTYKKSKDVEGEAITLKNTLKQSWFIDDFTKKITDSSKVSKDYTLTSKTVASTVYNSANVVKASTQTMYNDMTTAKSTVSATAKATTTQATQASSTVKSVTTEITKNVGSVKEFVVSGKAQITKDTLAASTNAAANSATIIKALTSARSDTINKSKDIQTKLNSATSYANSQAGVLKGTNSAALSDTENKSKDVQNKWNGTVNHANTQAGILNRTNQNAERNTSNSGSNITNSVKSTETNVKTATSNINRTNSDTQAKTKNSTDDIKSNVKSAERETDSKGKQIIRHGNDAKSNTNSSMNSVMDDFADASKDSENKSNDIIGYAKDAEQQTETKTSSIKKAWDNLKDDVSKIKDSILGWLGDILKKIGDTQDAANDVHAPDGNPQTVRTQTEAKGGRVKRIPVAAKGRKIRLSDNISANLTAMAHAVGEDVMVAAKEGEGIFTERQTNDLEELIELTPELINSTKKYAQFANLFKSLTVNPQAIQDNITNNLSNAAKGANGNILNSQSVKNVSMQIGDVVVQGVQNVNDFASKIKSNLPNAMLQELMSI